MNNRQTLTVTAPCVLLLLTVRILSAEPEIQRESSCISLLLWLCTTERIQLKSIRNLGDIVAST
jgi:hypothetical protein